MAQRWWNKQTAVSGGDLFPSDEGREEREREKERERDRERERERKGTRKTRKKTSRAEKGDRGSWEASAVLANEDGNGHHDQMGLLISYYYETAGRAHRNEREACLSLSIGIGPAASRRRQAGRQEGRAVLCCPVLPVISLSHGWQEEAPWTDGQTDKVQVEVVLLWAKGRWQMADGMEDQAKHDAKAWGIGRRKKKGSSSKQRAVIRRFGKAAKNVRGTSVPG